MASFIPFNCFAADFADGQHLLDKDVLKMALATGVYNAETQEYEPIPLNKTNWNNTDFPEPFGSLSYPFGGYVLEKTKYIENDKIYSLFLGNMEFFCPENQFFGPFRYLVIYNHAISDRLMGYYDYTANIELNSGESFFIDFDPDKIVPAIKIDTTAGATPPTPAPTPTPTPPPPISPVGFTFLDQTGTGDYVGTYSGKGIGNTPPVNPEPLEVKMLSDGNIKYMNFKATRNGILHYKYSVKDPNKTEATASMSINGYQQSSANRFTGTVSSSVNVKIDQFVVFSFNSGYIPEGTTSSASANFSVYID